jgi:uncharacterized glyoxalase superfamily metalloenzyme YdcJ
MSHGPLVDTRAMRREFSNRLSALYAAEVPLYGQLVATVREVNREVVRAQPQLGWVEGDVDRLSEERHGAIRLGREDEMRTMAGFFAALGMRAVNFYDLSAAGAKALPIIATAFRPVDRQAIEVSPFRVFCSLLRPDDERFFRTADLRRRVKERLAARDIFTPRLRALIDAAQKQGGLDREQADAFLAEGVELFRWRGRAADKALYDELVAGNLALAADICCLPNPHLNHLTPNTLDIDALQARMRALLATKHKHVGAEMKDHIEGPPHRAAPILLRQTSYKALTEPVVFDGATPGAHTARFGEIEQRGLALTPAGRRRYDEALARVEAVRAGGRVPAAADYEAAYAHLPEDFEALRRAGLGYFHYEAAGKTAGTAGAAAAAGEAGAGGAGPAGGLDALVAQGLLRARPIRYEDFLPVSAAGIFASNLRSKSADLAAGEARYAASDLEAILERPIVDSFAMYAAQEARSLLAAHRELGVPVPAETRAAWEKAVAADPSAQ